MISDAKTVDQYIEELPEDRKGPFLKLFKAIQDSIPEGFELTMQYGMPGFVVPHSIYPAGYHCKPSDALPFASLANQKQGINFYHMGLYGHKDLMDWFVQEFPKHSSRKLDMGKSCIRFRGGKDIPYELIGELMGKISVQEYIDKYESGRKPQK